MDASVSGNGDNTIVETINVCFDLFLSTLLRAAPMRVCSSLSKGTAWMLGVAIIPALGRTRSSGISITS